MLELPTVDDASFGKFARRSLAASSVRIKSAHLSADDLDSVIHLAANGVNLQLEQADRWTRVLGSALADLLSEPITERSDPELRAARLRRTAIRTHGARGWANRLDEALGLRAVNDNTSVSVSVLLASRRPSFVLDAVRRAQSQRWVETQLIVGLHGDAFSGSLRSQVVDMVGDAGTVHQFASDRPLGAVLHQLSSLASDTDLITKWDDDDWYGQYHLSDLAAAADYSGAEVVGKRAEFVYLEAADRTIRRTQAGSESVDWSIAGGTIMTTNRWLKRIGGWKPIPRGVDRALIDDTRNVGGSVYRTHGFQYMLRRSCSSDHTWKATDNYFLRAATASRPGLALEWADIEID